MSYALAVAWPRRFQFFGVKWRLYLSNGKPTKAREKAALMETNSTVCSRLSGILPSL